MVSQITIAKFTADRKHTTARHAYYTLKPPCRPTEGHTMFSSEDNELSMLQTAITHAQSWVELHANQRQNLFNFFLIAVAFLFNAYVSAINGHHHFLAGLISLLGAIISLTFMSMDLRNRDLTRAGEVTLKDLENRIADWYNLPSIRIVEAVDKPRHSWLSMGKMMRIVHIVMGVTFLAATAYAFVA